MHFFLPTGAKDELIPRIEALKPFDIGTQFFLNFNLAPSIEKTFDGPEVPARTTIKLFN